MSKALLDIGGLDAYYDQSHVLQGVSFAIARGEVVTLLGRNGAGKTTTLKTIMGIVPARRGVITFDSRALGGLPTYRIGSAGIAYVPETRDIFPSLSVEENLTLAARPGNGGGWTVERVYELFPKLGERANAGGDRRIVVDDARVHKRACGDSLVPEHLKKPRHARAQAVLGPAEIGNVGHRFEPVRRRQELARHGLIERPRFDIDDDVNDERLSLGRIELWPRRQKLKGYAGVVRNVGVIHGALRLVCPGRNPVLYASAGDRR